jgi:hypothetical protein
MWLLLMAVVALGCLVMAWHRGEGPRILLFLVLISAMYPFGVAAAGMLRNEPAVVSLFLGEARGAARFLMVSGHLGVTTVAAVWSGYRGNGWACGGSALVAAIWTVIAAISSAV